MFKPPKQNKKRSRLSDTQTKEIQIKNTAHASKGDIKKIKFPSLRMGSGDCHLHGMEIRWKTVSVNF